MGFVALGISAAIAVCLPLSAFAETAPKNVVELDSDDLTVALPAGPVVVEVEAMMLALEDQNIGDDSLFGAQREAPMPETRLAGLTSLAALRERIRQSQYAPPARRETVPIVLQVGSFADRENAVRLENSLASEFRTVYVTQSQLGGRRLFRVRVGSFATLRELESAEQLLRSWGHTTWRLHTDASDSAAEQLHSYR